MKKPEIQEFNHPCCVYGSCAECMIIEKWNQALKEMDTYWRQKVEGAKIMRVLRETIIFSSDKDVADAIKALLLERGGG